MIRRKDEQTAEIRKNMRGGPGEVMIKHYFRQEEINPHCRLCAQLTLAPGAGIGLHVHAREDEVFIIQQGRGIVQQDGRDIEVGVGDALVTGKGASHSIRNNGSEDLIVTAVIILE
jgi:mannose-6-phosphate isomerase-like protein (cupin superfamily)